MTQTKVQLAGGEEVQGILPAANGGTGVASPGTSGNVLASNGSAWVSSAPVVGSFFSIDGGSSTTTYTGTLRVDFGASS